MSGIVDRKTLERVSQLDLLLMQRHPQRDAIRAWRLALRHHPRIPFSSTPSANAEFDPSRGACLGGLEAIYDSAWSTTITIGAYLAPNDTPITETRPLTYSPAPAEADDDAWCLAEIVEDTPVVPASAPGGALAAPEYWLISAKAVLTTVETDSEREVFNEIDKVWDAVDGEKIRRHRLEFTVTRSAGNGPPPALPTAYDVPIALLYVPTGAVDLSDATYFDCRRLLEPGPNMVSGHGVLGFKKSDFSPTAAAQGTTTSSALGNGNWRARISNEEVSIHIGGRLGIHQIKQPSTSFDNGATPSLPKIAWVYLCKVQGYVPRPVRRGAVMLGGAFSEAKFMNGAVVVSPTPPLLGIRAQDDGMDWSAGRWNLHPSATLSLPSWEDTTGSGLVYNYEGVTVPSKDALCIGFVIYTDYDVGTQTPLLFGPGSIDTDGWYSIAFTDSGGATYCPSACLSDPLFGVFVAYVLSVTGSGVSYELKIASAKYTVSATEFKMPIDGIKVAVIATASSGLSEGRVLFPSWERFVAESATRLDMRTGPIWLNVNDIDTVPNNYGQVYINGTPADLDVQMVVTAVRFPYNEPLAG